MAIGKREISAVKELGFRELTSELLYSFNYWDGVQLTVGRALKDYGLVEEELEEATRKVIKELDSTLNKALKQSYKQFSAQN